MARALSDTVIVSMIEAATRLAGGRGPIAGSMQSTAAGADATAAARAGDGTAPAASDTLSSPAGGAAPAATPSGAPRVASGTPAGDHDSRSAEQIAADFRTIYKQIEDVVRSSATEETRPVGFGGR
jgi:hypothetical protein